MQRYPRLVTLHILLPVLLLGGCAGLRNDAAVDWPDALPPYSFFLTEYQNDTELQEYQTLDTYIYWVRAFYEGTAIYPMGWSDITRGILAATSDPDTVAKRERQLYALGCDIAAEWSKDNSINRIKSGNLAVWGVAAQRAVEEDNVAETLDKIGEDVQMLLSLELTPDAITADRYHAPDPDDWFSF